MIAIWDNRLSTGNTAIDAEHRLVLNLLNELNVAFTVQVPRVVIQKALETLVRAVDRHFARDGLPTVGTGRDSPIRDHAAFSVAVHRLLNDWRDGTLQTIDRRTLVSLGSRWIDHMGRREAATPVTALHLPQIAVEQRLAG